MIKRGKETFAGYNKPKRTPGNPNKSHAVLAKEGDKVKLIRFGQQGVKGAGKNPKSEAEKARKASFKARHAKNISKGKMSAAYWANKIKWLVGYSDIPLFQSTIWVDTPHGEGVAILIIDYGIHQNTIWVVANKDDGRVRHYDSNDIKITTNNTLRFNNGKD
jgi:hypothetical protein